MISPEPSHSIHVAVVRFVNRLIGEAGADSDDPIVGDVQSSIYWGYMINMGWGLLAVGCVVAMGAATIPLQQLVSDGAGNVGICAGSGAGFFCLAGSAEAVWRRYVYVPRARRLANSGSPDRASEALRRSLPPNSSVVFQAAVGILAIVITAVNL
jgi:hypothetical protein